MRDPQGRHHQKSKTGVSVASLIKKMYLHRRFQCTKNFTWIVDARDGSLPVQNFFISMQFSAKIGKIVGVGAPCPGKSWIPRWKCTRATNRYLKESFHFSQCFTKNVSDQFLRLICRTLSHLLCYN